MAPTCKSSPGFPSANQSGAPTQGRNPPQRDGVGERGRPSAATAHNDGATTHPTSDPPQCMNSVSPPPPTHLHERGWLGWRQGNAGVARGFRGFAACAGVGADVGGRERQGRELTEPAPCFAAAGNTGAQVAGCGAQRKHGLRLVGQRLVRVRRSAPHARAVKRRRDVGGSVHTPEPDPAGHARIAARDPVRPTGRHPSTHTALQTREEPCAWPTSAVGQQSRPRVHARPQRTERAGSPCTIHARRPYMKEWPRARHVSDSRLKRRALGSVQPAWDGSSTYRTSPGMSASLAFHSTPGMVALHGRAHTRTHACTYPHAAPAGGAEGRGGGEQRGGTGPLGPHVAPGAAGRSRLVCGAFRVRKRHARRRGDGRVEVCVRVSAKQCAVLLLRP